MRNYFLIILVLLVTASHNAHAYRWIFSNFTDHMLIIKVKLRGTNNNYYNIVKPDKTADFEWGFGNPKLGFCLEYFKWMKPNASVLQALKAGKAINNKYEVIHTDKMDDILENIARKPSQDKDKSTHILQSSTVKFNTDPLFQDTLKHGSKLGTKLVRWIGNAIAESGCRSRDYGIAEVQPGKFIFFTKKN